MIKTETIRQAFMQTDTDKHHTHLYDRWYYEVFKNYTPESLLEIGVKKGKSLAAWRLIFPDADIGGVDITDEEFSENYIRFSDAKINIGDSTNKEQMSEVGTYDVIIDDGSHYYKDIIRTFINFKDRFNHAYIIEDSMYKMVFTVKLFKRLGYKNIKIYPSTRQNIPVNTGWLKTKKYCGNHMTKVNLNMIVIFKD